MATVVSKVGTEFLVNSITTGSQSLGKVALLSDGKYVITWDSTPPSGDNDIKAQMFDASGNAIGSEFQVNTQTASYQTTGDVTALTGGGFVVTWMDHSGTLGDSSDTSIKAQIFSSTGTKVGSEFLVNTQTSGTQFRPTITNLQNGGFVVTWYDESGTLGDSSDTSVKAQIFSSTGTKVGSEFLVNTQTNLSQSSPEVTTLTNGNFVVTWTDSSGGYSNPSVKSQVYDATGTKIGSELSIAHSGSTQTFPAVAALKNGGFVVTWEDHTPALDALNQENIKAQIYNASGTAVGAPFLANTSPAAIVGAAVGMDKVIGLDNGGFAAVWLDDVSTSSSGQAYNIMIQAFDASGTKIGSEIVVNSPSQSNRGFPSIEALNDGKFIVTWTGYNPPPNAQDGSDLKSQIFQIRIEGTSGNDTLTGGDYHDVMVGFGGNDTIDGGAGADNMAGGTGDDIYYVDNTGDVVTELVGEGNDTVYASVNYTLAAGSEVETLRANAGSTGLTLTGNEFNNTIIGGSGSDTLNGGNGNDTLDGGAGADAMTGGGGNDTYYVDNTGDTVTEAVGEGNDTVYASVNYTLAAGSEVETLRANAGSTGLTLTGNEFNNTIIGGSGNDTLNGGGGNDTLDGGAGADAMTGGTGDDTYYVDNTSDAVTELTGEGNDTVYASVNYTLAAGSEVETLRANAGSTGLTLTGNEFNNTIVGGAGVDTMAGGTGNDTYYVQNTGDAVTEAMGEGNDTVYTSVNYTLAAGSEIETLIANAGSTGLTLTGNEFNNTIVGGAGNDIISGGSGADTMSGGTGNDAYYVDNVGDTVTELTGQGIDDRVYTSVDFTLTAGNEIESIWANAGSTGLTLTGNELNNTIIGGAGDDTIIGGGGNDVLMGGAGADAMSGGTGNDVYYVDNVGDTVTELTGEGTDDRVYTSADFTLASGSEIESIWANAGSTGLVLTGNELNNTVIGGAGDDTIIGGGGNDVLMGGTGADTMSGGTGNDVYYVDNVGDTVTELAGQGTDDRVYTSADFTLAAGSEVESIWANAGSTGLTLTGNELDNTIIGGAGNDTLIGGGGNDVLMGGAGADAMTGGTGNDVYYVDNVGDTVTELTGEGTDDRVYTSADFTLASGSEIESIWANAGSTGLTLTGNELNNTIIGGSGNDTINGGGGDDVLMGGAGADAMTGGTGNDVYYVDNVGDTVTELAGEGTDDRVYTSSDFTLAAGSEIESIWANAGSTGLTLTGNELSNTIIGGSGNDTISGGGGADALYGGAGADSFVFNFGKANGGAVTDFTTSTDHLDFFGFGTAGSGATLTQVGASDYYELTPDSAHGGASAAEVIQIVNVFNLTSSDFLFH